MAREPHKSNQIRNGRSESLILKVRKEPPSQNPRYPPKKFRIP
jgi:hypothetical protein